MAVKPHLQLSSFCCIWRVLEKERGAAASRAEAQLGGEKGAGGFSLGAWKQTTAASPPSPESFFPFLSPPPCPCSPRSHRAWLQSNGLVEPLLCACREMCAPAHSSRNSGRPRARQNHYCCLPTPAPGSEATLSHGLLVTSIYFLRLLHIHVAGL